MDVVFIDAKKSLGAKAICDFKSGQSDDVMVTMYIEPSQLMFEKPMSKLREFFEDEEIETAIQSDNDVISFITDNAVLQFTGLDYNWWIAVVRNKKRRRLDRLFADVNQNDNEEKPAKQTKQKSQQISDVTCYCGTKVNNEIVDILTYTGSKKECVNFINKEYQLRRIKTFFKADVVYRFSLDEEWQSFEELTEKGVFLV